MRLPLNTRFADKSYLCPGGTLTAPDAASHLSATGFWPSKDIGGGHGNGFITYEVNVNPLFTDNLGLCLPYQNDAPPYVYYPWYVDGTLYLDGGRKLYVLDEYETLTNGSTVKPYAPNSVYTLKNITEFPGLINLSLTCPNEEFYDGNGPLITATITGGATPNSPVPSNPERRTVPEYPYVQGNKDTVQAEVLKLATSPTANAINETFAVRGGLTYQLDISYQTGTDPYGLSDPELFWLERKTNVSVSAGCEVDLAAPSLSCTAETNGGCFLGAIVAQVDMLTDSEIPETELHAINGPMGNFRYGKVVGDPMPSSGTCVLTNVMPTNLGLDPRDRPPGQDPPYDVNAYLTFCSGGYLENFQSPTATASVTNCTTTDMTNTFVMNPSTASGRLNFVGPDGSLTNCPNFLQYLELPPQTLTNNCLPVVNGQPITNVTRSSYSYVSASGGGGGAQAFFSLSGGNGVYSGKYDLTLASLHRQTTTWYANQLALYFNHTGAVPDNEYINESLSIINSNLPPISVDDNSPVYLTGRDHDYCFSDVTIDFTAATAGTKFFNPYLSGTGSFIGSDYQGNPAKYTNSVSASGTPTTSGTAAASGEVNLCLPAGTYTLTPRVQYDGDGSSTLPNITFTVGCNQCYHFSGSGLVLSVSNIPCISGTNVAVVSGTATAQAGATLVSIVCEVNHQPIGIATSSPFTFSFFPKSPDNTVTVVATDNEGHRATFQQTVSWASSVPLTISGCQDIVVDSPSGAPVNVYFNHITAGSGRTPVTLTFNPPAPGPFSVGTHQVTCTAVDACGNTTNCTFNVIVQACPTLTDNSFSCISNGLAFNYNFSVSDPVGGTPIDHFLLIPESSCFSFNPALITPTSPIQPGDPPAAFNTQLIAGSGCPKQLCFVVDYFDAASNVICSDEHCLTNPALPQIDCPPDIVTNCQSDSGTYVNYTFPTATSLCCSNVSVSCSPPPGLFPIGVTPVVCTAVDSCGQSNTCTFYITVVGHGNTLAGGWVKADGMPGLSGASRANGVAVDADGNAYVCGTYFGSVSFLNPDNSSTLLTSAGGADIFLAKYDASGNLLWVRSAGGSAGNDEALGVAVDAQGNCFITGSFTNSATFSTTTIPTIPVGAQDGFVAKYDPQGNVLWALAITGSGPETGATGAGVAVDASGSCYVTGNYRDGANFESMESTPVWYGGFGVQDCFLAKYNANGALQWVTNSSGSGPYVVAARGVAVDPSGQTVWIMGDFSANASSAPQFGNNPAFSPSTGWGDAFVAQCDASTPTPKWTWARQTFPTAGASTADGRQIGVDDRGNCYFTAYFHGQTGISANNQAPAAAAVTPPACNSFNNYLVGSFDFNGNPRWLQQGTGCGDDESYGLAVNAATGETFASGFLQGAGLLVSGGRDVAVHEYDSNGKLEWTGTGLGSSTNSVNVGSSVALDPAGCVYVAGGFTDTNLFFPGFPNPTLSLTSGDQAMFVAKYCPGCSPCIQPFCMPTVLTNFTNPTGEHGADVTSGVTVQISTNSPPTNSINYLDAKDLPGSSVIYVGGMAGDFLCSNACYSLCYDFRVFNDGTSATPPSSTPIPIHPSFVLVSDTAAGVFEAEWVANAIVTEDGGSNPGWHEVCAPIAPLNSNGTLPSNDNGAWHMITGTDGDWNSLLAQVTAIRLNFDYTSSQWEEVGYANFCLSNTACDCLQITCPDIVVTNCAPVQVFYTPQVTSCCSNLSVICTPPSGHVFSPDTVTTVHCQATDGCNHTATCSFNVTVLCATNNVVHASLTNDIFSINGAFPPGWSVQSSTDLFHWTQLPYPTSPPPYSINISNTPSQFFRLAFPTNN